MTKTQGWILIGVAGTVLFMFAYLFTHLGATPRYPWTGHPKHYTAEERSQRCMDGYMSLGHTKDEAQQVCPVAMFKAAAGEK